MAALVDEKRRDYSMYYAGFRSKPPELCVSLPLHPEPDARSKVDHPLAWHLDFREGQHNAARSSQLKQLDALNGAGLLSKVSVTVAGDAARRFTRYRLTSKGWAASNWKYQTPCLVFGYQHVPLINGFERKQVTGLPNVEWYEVTGTTGAGPIDDLAEWARSAEVRSAFPEIDRQLAGVPFQVLFTWDGKQWVDAYTFMQRKNRPQREGGTDAQQQTQPHLEEAIKRERAHLEKLGPPTVDEVKSILNARYGEHQKEPSSMACIALPGDSRLPVDRELTPRTPNRGYGRYAVAVFTNKKRPIFYDPVWKKTRPYLETLQSLGVMMKQSQQGMSGNGAEGNLQFDADVYELAPPFATAMDTERSNCLSLGKPTVEFVVLELSEPGYEGVPVTFVRYKLRIRYKAPPSWVKEPQVAGWDEVQSALQHGRACDGHFEFNRRERILWGGGGSCWWAFDSYAEND